MFDRLPARIQMLALAAFERFQEDPLHPGLDLHELDDHGRGKHAHKSDSA